MVAVALENHFSGSACFWYLTPAVAAAGLARSSLYNRDPIGTYTNSPCYNYPYLNPLGRRLVGERPWADVGTWPLFETLCHLCVNGFRQVQGHRADRFASVSVCPGHDIGQHVRRTLCPMMPSHILDEASTVTVTLENYFAYFTTVLAQELLYIVTYCPPYQIIVRAQKFCNVEIGFLLLGAMDFVEYLLPFQSDTECDTFRLIKSKPFNYSMLFFLASDHVHVNHSISQASDKRSNALFLSYNDRHKLVVSRCGISRDIHSCEHQTLPLFDRQHPYKIFDFKRWCGSFAYLPTGCVQR